MSGVTTGHFSLIAGTNFVDMLLRVGDLGHLHALRSPEFRLRGSCCCARRAPFPRRARCRSCRRTCCSWPCYDADERWLREHHLRDVTFVLALADGRLLAVVEVVPLPFLEEVKPFLVHMNEVLEVMKPSGAVESLLHPPRHPLKSRWLSFTGEQRLECGRVHPQSKFREVEIARRLLHPQRRCLAALCGTGV